MPLQRREVGRGVEMSLMGLQTSAELQTESNPGEVTVSGSAGLVKSNHTHTQWGSPMLLASNRPTCYKWTCRATRSQAYSSVPVSSVVAEAHDPAVTDYTHTSGSCVVSKTNSSPRRLRVVDRSPKTCREYTVTLRPYVEITEQGPIFSLEST
jgi:hypothetical protein